MITSEIIKWVFIVVMTAPLPILVVIHILGFIKEKVQEYIQAPQSHRQE